LRKNSTIEPPGPRKNSQANCVGNNAHSHVECQSLVCMFFPPLSFQLEVSK
jgi:hypothetical protein